MAAITVSDVLRVLRETVDPEVGINIVDLGLIYGVRVDGKNNVRVEMTMTSPMCPLTGIIMADVKLRLEHLRGVAKVELGLVWEPAWSPAMMSDESRAAIGAFD